MVTQPPLTGWNRVLLPLPASGYKKNEEKSKILLDIFASSCNYRDMTMIRDTILKQMLKLRLTIHEVSKLVEGKVPQRTVYAFLTGEKDTGTKTASIIMKALGLGMKVEPEKTKTLEVMKMKTEKPKSFRGRVMAEWERAGKPRWNGREMLAICLLIDFEFKVEGRNPAAKFRAAVEAQEYSYMSTWAQGLHFPFEEA